MENKPLVVVVDSESQPLCREIGMERDVLCSTADVELVHMDDPAAVPELVVTVRNSSTESRVTRSTLYADYTLVDLRNFHLE